MFLSTLDGIRKCWYKISINKFETCYIQEYLSFVYKAYSESLVTLLKALNECHIKGGLKVTQLRNDRISLLRLEQTG